MKSEEMKALERIQGHCFLEYDNKQTAILRMAKTIACRKLEQDIALQREDAVQLLSLAEQMDTARSIHGFVQTLLYELEKGTPQETEEPLVYSTSCIQRNPELLE